MLVDVLVATVTSWPSAYLMVSVRHTELCAFQPEPLGEMPELTVRIARAALFPKS